MLLQDAYDFTYDFIFNDDVENKVLVRNSYAIATFLAVYILFVQWVGPNLMKHRKPFNLQKVIIIYNFSQMIVNMFIAFQFISLGHNIWDDRCMIYQSTRYPQILQCIKQLSITSYVVFLVTVTEYFQAVKLLTWYTYLVKMVDCLDTVFFVLRKKNKQISFLHVFHHSSICVLCHAYLKYLRMGYYLIICVTINNIIHVIMYFYYALAAFGPSMQKYLWWKKYLTLLQMIQFSIVLTYMFVGFFTGCESPGVEEVAMASFVGLVFIMFINFYRNSFTKNVK